MVADFVLLDSTIDEYGNVWGTIEGKSGVESLIASKFKSIKLHNQGIIIELEREEGTYLASYLDPEQEAKVVAKLIADILISQEINKIEPFKI